MSSRFLYHWVPKNMQGDILYPLNELKELMPEVYAEHVKKYVGRERVMTRTIPFLNCLWNDVLHTTSAHPKKVSHALREAGIEPKEWKAFAIPAEMIVGPNSLVYLYKQKDDIYLESDDNYAPFREEDIESYATIPEGTIEYYKACRMQSKRPLIYHLVPHILYKGSIDTKGLDIISNL